MAYISGTSTQAVKSGNAAFFVMGSYTQFTQSSTTGQFFAGVVEQNLLNILTLPLSPFSISPGTNFYVVTSGDVAIYLAKANENESLPLVGSIIYAMNDGTFQSQIPTKSAPLGSLYTPFKVKSIPLLGWSPGEYIIVSSN